MPEKTSLVELATKRDADRFSLSQGRYVAREARSEKPSVVVIGAHNGAGTNDVVEGEQRREKTQEQKQCFEGEREIDGFWDLIWI
ncbi:hypothetical protein TIFTF001_014067 [Ficus carica]|uniref:Uncharacterized protein n=1 Tax=Ficus carica TaxID=3494 RepID=A0AA88AFD9_FICCA|nr:hypothetical protein TIFTF001_014067 [Ficus carica]